MNSEDEFKYLKKNGDSSCFHSPIPPSDWRYVGADLANPMSACKTDLIGAPVSSAGSYFQWEDHNNPDSLAFCNISLQSDSNNLEFRKGFSNMSGIYPPGDSAFVERDARISCINGLNFSDMLNRFGCGESVIPNNEPNVAETDYLKVVHGGVEERFLKNERRHCDSRFLDDGKVGFALFGNGDAEFSNSGEGEASAKKRKRSSQIGELNQGKGVEIANCGNQNHENGEQNPVSIPNKCVGKQALEVPKDEYIHVRARRGQATNSHSLAERVRREKISERMKLLQDLVPGCSKVTGKTVMLDEIINYVQSLQQQVELLSMKLATVNPQLDLNIDGLVTKNVGSSSLGFSQDTAMAYAQPGLIQPGLPAMPGPHLSMMNVGFREPPQLPNVWEDELHNVVQMSIETPTPSDRQHVIAPPSQMKIEL